MNDVPKEQDAPDSTFSFSHLDWSKIEILFIRGLAAFILLRGLFVWGQIIGIGSFDFLALWTQAQIYLSFCAILGVVAGVGLWMMTSWGRVLWLFLSIVMIIFDFSSLIGTSPSWHSLMVRHRLITFIDVLLIGTYFTVMAQVVIFNRKTVRI